MTDSLVYRTSRKSTIDFKKKLKFLLIVSPFFDPSFIGLAYPMTLKRIFICWKIIALIYCLISIRYFPKSVIIISCVYVPIIVSTIINNGDIITAFFQYAYVFGIALAVNHTIISCGAKSACNILLLVLEILIYTNLILMIAFPRGLYHTSYLGVQLGSLETASGLDRVGWLLGHQSLSSSYSIPAISIAATYSYYNKNKICTRAFVLIVAACMQAFLSRSAMNTFVLAVMALFFLANGFGIIRRFLKSYWFIFLMCLIVTIGILYFNVLQLFEGFIVNVLNRSIDLSGRLQVWRYAMTLGGNRFLLGNGLESENLTALCTVNATHAHNEYIQSFYISGIIGLVGLMFFFRGFLRRTNYLLNKRLTSIPIISCYGCMILMLTDVYIMRHPIIVVPFVILTLFKHDEITGQRKRFLCEN
jgi:O-antigen ligase